MIPKCLGTTLPRESLSYLKRGISEVDKVFAVIISFTQSVCLSCQSVAWKVLWNAELNYSFTISGFPFERFLTYYSNVLLILMWYSLLSGMCLSENASTIHHPHTKKSADILVSVLVSLTFICSYLFYAFCHFYVYCYYLCNFLLIVSQLFCWGLEIFLLPVANRWPNTAAIKKTENPKMKIPTRSFRTVFRLSLA